ncbi:MAG: DUF2784 domain-containing protein [Nitrospirae bacterium]|nr:DUF2784 domain-containing protein [Nitrospirota bacterium]
MFYKIAADIIVLIHFLWIAFLIVGAFPGRKNKWVKIFHIGGIGLAIVIQVFGWYCTLTHLEIWLRRMHNPSLSYEGSFIIYYVEKLVYFNLSPEIIFSMTIGLLLLSAWLYIFKFKN